MGPFSWAARGTIFAGVYHFLRVHSDVGTNENAHFRLENIDENSKYCLQYEIDEDGFVFSPQVDGGLSLDENGRSDPIFILLSKKNSTISMPVPIPSHSNLSTLFGNHIWSSCYHKYY